MQKVVTSCDIAIVQIKSWPYDYGKIVMYITKTSKIKRCVLFFTEKIKVGQVLFGFDRSFVLIMRARRVNQESLRYNTRFNLRKKLYKNISYRGKNMKQHFPNPKNNACLDYFSLNVCPLYLCMCNCASQFLWSIFVFVTRL